MVVTDEVVELAELEAEKEKIWDRVVTSPWGSDEGKRYEQQYVDICRKIAWKKQTVEKAFGQR